MNHDITHCTGDRCTIKGKCKRYIAYKELKDNKSIVPMAIISPPEYVKEVKKCNLYLINE